MQAVRSECFETLPLAYSALLRLAIHFLQKPIVADRVT